MIELVKKNAVLEILSNTNVRGKYKMPFSGGGNSDEDEAKDAGFDMGFREAQNKLRGALIRAIRDMPPQRAVERTEDAIEGIVQGMSRAVVIPDRPILGTGCMYDTHRDANGSIAHIFSMDDRHLTNLINWKVRYFCEKRDDNEQTTSEDPMLRAMVKREKWTNEELMLNTRLALNDLTPYLQEALVRGGDVAAKATEAMRKIAKREGRVGGEKKTVIQYGNDWDRFDGGEALEVIP